MSTLSEIQAAVDKLPHPEQEILLEHLARKLGARPTITEGSRVQRERWLQMRWLHPICCFVNNETTSGEPFRTAAFIHKNWRQFISDVECRFRIRC